MFFSRGCQGLQPSRSSVSKPLKEKFWYGSGKGNGEPRRRPSWSLANFQAVFGILTGEDARPSLWETGLFPVYSQSARSAHPARSPVFGSSINRCAGCRVSKSNILTSEPASASKELLPILPRFQLSSMNRKTED